MLYNFVFLCGLWNHWMNEWMNEWISTKHNSKCCELVKLCHVNRFGPVFFVKQCMIYLTWPALQWSSVVRSASFPVHNTVLAIEALFLLVTGTWLGGDLIRGLFIENSGNECRFLVEDNIVAKRRARRRLGVANCKLRASWRWNWPTRAIWWLTACLHVLLVVL